MREVSSRRPDIEYGPVGGANESEGAPEGQPAGRGRCRQVVDGLVCLGLTGAVLAGPIQDQYGGQRPSQSSNNPKYRPVTASLEKDNGLVDGRVEIDPYVKSDVASDWESQDSSSTLALTAAKTAQGLVDHFLQ